MKAGRMRYAICCAGLFVTLMLFHGFASHVYAVDVKDMLKQINKELRQAQRDMFGGKAEKAVASLELIKKKLIQARQADPNNPQIKSCENKYRKLVKDLERRTGKDLGGGSLTVAAKSTETELPPKPEAESMPEKEPSSSAAEEGDMDASAKEAEPKEVDTAKSAGTKKTDAEKLPYDARRPIRSARSDLSRIDSAIEKLSDPKWNADQLVENMKKHLENARKNLESGKTKAAEKGVTTHPEFDEIEAGIAEAEKKIAQAEAGHEKSKAEASAQAGEVTADVKDLKAEYDRVQQVFSKATGTVVHYNELETVKELVEQIEGFEKNELPGIKQKMAAFGKKYGTTKDEIDQKADAMGYVNNYYRASFAYTELSKGIENVNKTRTVMADDLIRRAKDMKKQTAKGIHDFARMKQQKRIKAWGQMAARLDAENPRVKAFNSGIDTWIEEDQKALHAKIDKAVFPKQAGDAPGDAKKLARTAQAFLQKEEEARAAKKGKKPGKILTVVVTGPWRVFKKNILGEPIQYNLPVACAVQLEQDKALNVVRVYLQTMLTREMKGVKMAPPFIGATVGDSYYIRPSAVK